MQKALNFLEKNVQWVALGLGGLYLLYILFGYVLTSPVTVELRTPGGAQVATLDTVDQYILEGPARQLQTGMENQSPIAIKVTEFSKQFSDSMKWMDAGIKPYDSKITWLNGTTAGIELADATKSGSQPRNNTGAQLPKDPPPAQYVGASTGRSRVPAQALVSESARATVVTDASGKPEDVDRLWASVGFKIPTDGIAKDFKAAKVPAARSQTMILRVVAVRQERLPDGTWGPETTVKPLVADALMPLPDKGQAGMEVPYQQWAASSQLLILQPAFYPTVGGDVWYVPGTEPPPPPVIPFDPSKVRPQDVAKLTPEQMKVYLQYQAQEKQRLQQERSRNRPTRANDRRGNMPGMGAPPDIGGFGFSPSALDSMGPLAQVQPRGAYAPALPGQLPGGMMPGFPGGPDDIPPDMQQMPGYSPNAQVDPKWAADQKTAAGTLPQGAFDPAKTSTFLTWVHDVDVKPGAVYRYRVRYAVLNPLYHAAEVAGSQEAMETFALQSQYSAWSDPVSIPPVTAFFADGGIYNETARFQVFHWQNGVWHGKSFIVSPGDLIGQKVKEKDGTEVDYTTDWTLVATSDQGAPNPYAIVTTEGTLHRREVRADQADTLFQTLKRKVAEAAALAAPSASAGMTPAP